MSRPGIEPTTSSRTPSPFGYRDSFETDLYFKLLQYSEVTGNAWGVSKHVSIQCIKLIMVIYVLQQTVRQNLHVDVLLFTFKLCMNFQYHNQMAMY